MPLYDFKNKETDEVIEVYMKYTELDQFKEDNPHLVKMVSAPKVDTGPQMPTKPPEDFRNLLKKMAKGQVNGNRKGSDHTINSF